MTTLYRHRNNTDVAAEIVTWYQPPGKDYAKIKVCWWNISKSNCHPPWCMNVITQLTDATIVGNKEARSKYPVAKWEAEWIRLT